MKSILKLMWANIRHGKGAFKGIALLMMIITFSFSGTVSNNDRLAEARAEKFDEASVADLILYIYDDDLSDEMLKDVEEHKDVQSVRCEEMINFCSAIRNSGEEKDLGFFAKPWDENVRVFDDDAGSFVSDNSLEAGGIFLPYKMKMLDGFSVGSEIELRTHNGYDEKFTVKGFYEDIILGASTMGVNCAVLSQEDFERICEDKLDSVYSENCCAAKLCLLSIDGKNGIKPMQLRRQLADDTTIISSSFNACTRDDLITSIEMYSRVGSRTIIAFVALLLTVTLITMYNSISSSIDLDYTELGILKANGFTKNRISLVYVLQYTLALIIGGIAGILVSIPACDYLIGTWKNVTGIMTCTGVSYMKCAVLCVIIIVICTAFIFIATAKISRISPVRAIAGGGSEVHFDSRLNTKIRQKPLSFFIALRQLNSRRRSYIGTALIVMMLVFFIVTILMLTGGLDLDERFYQISGEITVSNRGSLDLNNVDDLEKEIHKIDEGAKVESATYHYMLIDGERTAMHYYRSQKDVFKPDEGRVPKYDNEIMITKNISELIDKKIGDTVNIAYMDKEADFVVTGYFQSIWDFGMVCSLTEDGMKKMGYDTINEAYVRLGDISKEQEVIDMINDKYKGKLDAAVYEKDDTSESYKKVAKVIMNTMTVGMNSIILLFAIVIVNMVCKRTFIRERRDIGIFKAVGFTAGSLRTQFAVRFTFIALIGSALGCIVSIFWSRRALTYVLRIVGLTDFTADYSLHMFIIPALLVVVSFFVTAYISAYRVKRVQVRELITE